MSSNNDTKQFPHSFSKTSNPINSSKPTPDMKTFLQVLYDLLLFLWDLLVFMVLSPFYLLESLFYTTLPPQLRKLQDLTGRIVLVTGGANGTGRELVAQLARLGAKVVIWDVDSEALKLTKDQVENETGLLVHTYLVDLTDRQAVYKTAESVRTEIGHVEILINNAGVVYGRTLMELEDHMIEKTFQVNILAHYWTTRAFLPDMIKFKRGHIVTIGSVAGLMGTYLCTDYSATKFATVGFHESLYTELKTHGHDYIGVTLVCPYFINTGMFAGTKPRLMPMLEPQEVAASTIAAIRKNEVLCILPTTFRFFSPLKFWLPAKMCWCLMRRVIRGPESMSTFRGHLKTK